MMDSNRKRINLHLGAHKTATTYIQEVLQANKNELARHGIKYLAMQDVRDNITKNIMSYVNRGMSQPLVAQNIRNYVDERFGDGYEVLVISDENIIGVCEEVYRKSELYPEAVERLQLLYEALRAYDIHVYFSIRNYVEFFPSAYCEYLRHSAFVTFEEYIGGIDLEKDYWVRIVNEISDVFGEARTHIWVYEDFREKAVKIISEIISFDEIPIKYAVSNERPSMSDLSIRVLYKLKEVLMPNQIKKLVDAVSSAFPKGSEYREYMPWDEEYKVFLTEKYKKEIEAIRRQKDVIIDFD